jgi:hypothetical protein
MCERKERGERERARAGGRGALRAGARAGLLGRGAAHDKERAGRVHRVRLSPPRHHHLRWERDETCPVSTEGGTRRVQLVREGGGGGATGGGGGGRGNPAASVASISLPAGPCPRAPSAVTARDQRGSGTRATQRDSCCAQRLLRPKRVVHLALPDEDPRLEAPCKRPLVRRGRRCPTRTRARARARGLSEDVARHLPPRAARRAPKIPQAPRGTAAAATRMALLRGAGRGARGAGRGARGAGRGARGAGRVGEATEGGTVGRTVGGRGGGGLQGVLDDPLRLHVAHLRAARARERPLLPRRARSLSPMRGGGRGFCAQRPARALGGASA